MALIPNPATMLADGALRFFRGLRTGDQRTLLAGAALAAFGWYRKTRPPKRTLLRTMVVRPGQAVVIRNGSGQEPVAVVRGDSAST